VSSKSIGRRDQILSGSIIKLIITLALPVAINNLIIALYNLVDLFIISTNGKDEVASVTFTDPIISFFYAVSLAITVASTTLVARKIGEGDLALAKKNIIQTIILVGGVGVLIAIGGYIFAPQILKTLGATDTIIHIAQEYFKIQMLVIPIKFIGDIYLGVQRAQGNNIKAMFINIFSILLKVISSYVFIIVLGYGITALAYSTLISFSVLSVVGLFDLFIKRGQFKIKLSEIKVDSKLLWPLFMMSIPLIVEKTSLSFSHVVVGSQTVQFSGTVLAAYGITNKINSIMFSTATGFGVALVSIISQNLGKGNIDRAKQSVRKTLAFAMLVSSVFLMIFFATRSYVVPLFTHDDAELYRHTINAMNVYSASVIPWTIFQVIIGVFQGSGHTTYSLVITFCRVFIFRVPVIYFFNKFTNLNEYGIWYGMLLANVLTAVVAIVLYYVVKWEKSPKLLKSNR
jgi:putative MATE family efflux protein